MPAIDSKLTDAKYGYDFVVATTQSSINSTMLTYINGLKTATVTKCWYSDDEGNSKMIDYNELVKEIGGADPFAVPNGTKKTPGSTVEKLYNMAFLAAFRITLGIPPGYLSDPASVPDVVVLGDNTSSVTYNMLCSKFQVIEMNYGAGPRVPPKWINLSQPSTGWVFQSKVDLRLTPVGSSGYSKLPPNVQQQVKNLGADAFGVQQLLFDLNNAGLQTVPTISGLDSSSTAGQFLTTWFVNSYFKVIQAAGQPVLNYTIVKHDNPATLIPTDLNMEVCPFLDPNGKAYAAPTKAQADLASLNYLCSVFGKPLPAAVPFSWNWVSAQDAKQFDGVVSINRNTFATYLKNQLSPSVPSNCLIPTAKITMTNLGFTKEYSVGISSGGTAAFASPSSGATVLTLHYENQAHDTAGLNDDEGEITLKPTYDISVSFQNDNIVITQHLNVYLSVRSLQTTVSGNIVDKLLKDTYKLGVDGNGKLAVNRQSDPLVDKSENPSTNDFVNLFTQVNQIVAMVKNLNFASTTFQSFPIAVVQNFVFPGGRTFLFKNMAFSNNQDLTAAITYADPTTK
ncbi:MAG: hypothetical protein Q9214_003206 [Letrouitia sp. 1 TL-2023]